MRKLLRVSLALLGVVAATSMSIATQPPAGRPQGKGGFQGGFGGGFGGGGVTSLIRSKTVQDDVKIDEAQKEKLTAWGKEFQTSLMETMREKMADLRSEPAKMQEAFAALQVEISEKAYKQLAEVLKPEQITRLKQIEVQVDGLRAFGKADVKKALSITDEQSDKIKDASDTAAKDMRDLGEEYGVRFPGATPMDAEKAKEYTKKAGAINKEAMDKIMASMTAEQKKKFEELTGPTIDVAKIRTETAGAGFQRKKKDD